MESADVSAGIGVAAIGAALPTPVALRAHTSNVCSMLLSRPVTVTVVVAAPPDAVVESPNVPDPAL